MALVKINSLTALSAITIDDELYVVEDPSGTPLSRKITARNLMAMGHGEIFVVGGASGLALSAGIWTKITQFATDGIELVCDADAANDWILATDGGNYEARFSLSGSVSTGPARIDLAVYENSASTHVRGGQTIESPGFVNIASSGFITAGVGSPVELWARSDIGTTLTPVEMSLTIRRIHA